MPRKREADESQWLALRRIPPEGFTAVLLESGAWFPERLDTYGRYANGPYMRLIFEVEAGRPVLRSLIFGDAASEAARDDGPPLTASVVHDLPLGQIVQWTIEANVRGTEAMRRADEARAANRPHQFLTQAESDDLTRRARAVSVRGRPVGDETLRRVAEIVRANAFDYCKQINEELHVSLRTASRWVAVAKDRGFLDEETSK